MINKIKNQLKRDNLLFTNESNNAWLFISFYCIMVGTFFYLYDKNTAFEKIVFCLLIMNTFYTIRGKV